MTPGTGDASASSHPSIRDLGRVHRRRDSSTAVLVAAARLIDPNLRRYFRHRRPIAITELTAATPSPKSSLFPALE